MCSSDLSKSQSDTAERPHHKAQPERKDAKKSDSSTVRNNTKPKQDPREAKDTSKDSLRAILDKVKRGNGKEKKKEPDQNTDSKQPQQPRQESRSKPAQDTHAASSDQPANKQPKQPRQPKPAHDKSRIKIEQVDQKKYNQTGSAPQRTDNQPAEVPLDVLRDLLED